MHITVIAMNEGHPGAYKAGRFFPNGEEVALEVVDTDEDPPKVKAPDGKSEVLDPRRIGQQSFKLIKKSPVLKVLADHDTQGVRSRAAYEAAKGSAEKASADLTGARLEITRLSDENAQLKARVAELEKQSAQSPPAQGASPPEGGDKHEGTSKRAGK